MRNMCGRFTLIFRPEEFLDYFRLEETPVLEDRFNIAPTQEVAVVREIGWKRRLDHMRWGLVPAWAESPSTCGMLINARAETVHLKPSFREALTHRRCIIPASGFYEWRKEGSVRQPYYLQPKEGSFMALAGLWERWQNPENPRENLFSCTVITTEANEDVRPMHDRMPAVLGRSDFDRWLDPSQYDPTRLIPLLRSLKSDSLLITPVSTFVNQTAHEGPRCIQPILF